MDTTTDTKVGKFLEINLKTGFYYKGDCYDENEGAYFLKDIHGDKIEIKKECVMVCKEVHR